MSDAKAEAKLAEVVKLFAEAVDLPAHRGLSRRALLEEARRVMLGAAPLARCSLCEERHVQPGTQFALPELSKSARSKEVPS